MPIPISTPAHPDLNVKSFTGLNGDHFQVVGTTPFNRVVVAATQANSQISVTTTALALSSFMPVGATFAEIYVEGNNIRWWDDGKVPTMSQGRLLPVGSSLWIESPSTFRFIAQTGTASITVAWYKNGD